MFLKENDLSKLKEFIATKKPHVVAVTAESKEALRIVEEVQRLIQELTEEAEMPAINVELVDNEVAMVYENSNKGQVNLRGSTIKEWLFSVETLMSTDL